MQKLDKQNYPETRQAVALIVLNRFSGEISEDLKTVLDKIVSLGYYEIEDVVNNKNPLFEGIFSEEKFHEIGREYFRFARRVLSENGKEILPEVEKKVGENNSKISVLERHKEIIGDNGHISVGNLKKLLPFERYELAKIQAKNLVKDFSFSINYFELTQEQRFEVAKIAINYDPFWVVARLSNFKLTQDQRFEIAKLSTTKKINNIHPLDTLYSYVKIFGLTQEQEFELVLLLTKNPNNSYRSVVFFDKILSLGFSTNQLFEIVKSLLHYDVSVINYLGQLRFSRLQELEVIKIALTQNISVLTRLYFIEKNLNYKETTDNVEGFLMILEASIGKMEECGLFSQEKLDILKHQGKYQRFENLKYLFIELLGFDDLDFSKFEDNGEPELEQKKKILFLSSFGFNEDFIKYFLSNNNISQATFEDFCTYVIRIKNVLGKQFFQRLNIENYLLDDKKLALLINFLKTISYIVQLLGLNEIEKNTFTDSLFFTINDFISKNYNISEVQNDVKNHFSEVLSGLTSPILETDKNQNLSLTLENILFITQNLNEIFLTFLKLVFKINGEGISIENIEKLENIWGDLEVLFVLIARFSSNQEWFEEIPILSKLVEILLNSGEEGFRNYKYFGNGGNEEYKELSEKQLSSLEGESLQNWLSNPNSLEYINTKNEGKVSEEELLKMGQGEFLDHLLRQRHFDLYKPGIVDQITSINENDFISELNFIKNGISNNFKPKDLLKGFSQLNENKGLSKKNLGEKFLLLLSHIARKTGNYFEFKYIIDLFQRGISGINLLEIKDDLESISSKLRPIESGDEVIIFTTVFDDPKLLLQIGDLVNSFSCQNYRVGEQIQTLLGYVIDANIKGIISFPITISDLGGKEQFDVLKEKIQSGIFNISFDAPKRTLKVDDIEVQLGKAINRRILRLGNKDGKAVLFSEKLYYSTHFAGGYSLDSLDNLLVSYAKNIGINIVNGKQGVNYAGTKNPGGVHVDALGTIQYDDYEI